MNYNPKSPFEKPPREMPERCEKCKAFKQLRHSGGCVANGFVSITYAVCKPASRGVPMPFNCYWWYANAAFKKCTAQIFAGIVEERAHTFVRNWLNEKMRCSGDHIRREEFIRHCFRDGGGHIISFDLFPEAQPLYDRFKRLETGEG